MLNVRSEFRTYRVKLQRLLVDTLKHKNNKARLERNAKAIKSLILKTVFNCSRKLKADSDLSDKMCFAVICAITALITEVVCEAILQRLMSDPGPATRVRAIFIDPIVEEGFRVLCEVTNKSGFIYSFFMSQKHIVLGLSKAFLDSSLYPEVVSLKQKIRSIRTKIFVISLISLTVDAINAIIVRKLVDIAEKLDSKKLPVIAWLIVTVIHTVWNFVKYTKWNTDRMVQDVKEELNKQRQKVYDELEREVDSIVREMVRADMRDLKSLKRQAYERLKRLEQEHWKNYDEEDSFRAKLG